MKKSVIVLLIVVLLITFFNYTTAELLRSPVCPYCGIMMHQTSYAGNDDMQLGTWTETRTHNGHEDIRYVWQETSIYICDNCGVTKPIGKILCHDNWVCP